MNTKELDTLAKITYHQWYDEFINQFQPVQSLDKYLKDKICFCLIQNPSKTDLHVLRYITRRHLNPLIACDLIETWDLR